MTETLAPLPADVRAQLSAELSRDPLPAEAHDRMWQALAGRLAAGAVPPGVDGGDGAGEAGEVVAAPPSVATGGTGQSLGRHLLTLTAGVAIGAAAALVAGAYSHVDSAHSDAVPRLLVIPHEVVRPEPPVADSARAGEPTSAEPASPKLVGAARPSQPVASRKHQPSSLSAERALIDRARAALARRDVKAAEQALAVHRQRHPKGQLSEEREALQIRALRASGRADDAGEQQKAFEKRYPDSMLAPNLAGSGGGR